MNLHYEKTPQDFPGQSACVLITATNAEGVVVGSVIVKLPQRSSVAEFAYLFVRREVRRHGIGRELLKQAEITACFAHKVAISCEVHPSNFEALQFYGALGFQAAFTFQGGEILMSKPLGGGAA